MEEVLLLVVPHLDPGAETLDGAATEALAARSRYLSGEALLQELVSARKAAAAQRNSASRPLLTGRACVLAALCGRMVASGAAVPDEMMEALLLLIEAQLPPFCHERQPKNEFLHFALRCAAECLARSQSARALAR